MKLSNKVPEEIKNFVLAIADAVSEAYTDFNAIELETERQGKKLDTFTYRLYLDDFMDSTFDSLVMDLNDMYGDDEDDLEESLLTEKVWKKKMDADVVNRFRKAIDEDNYPVIQASLELIYRIIHQMYPNEFNEEDLQDKLDGIELLPTDPGRSDELIDDYDIGLDVDEYYAELYDYELEQLYNICDTLSIWLSLD